MSTTYRIECYDGTQHPALHPDTTAEASTEREARRIAARMLGHRTLRGASSWESWQGGIVYRFGPRAEDSEYDYAVIIDLGDADDDALALQRADYDI